MGPRFDEFIPDGGSGEVVEYIYGFPLTSNPLDFYPDEESCTPEEIAAWKADCAEFEAGNPVPNPRAGSGWSYDENGKKAAHFLATRWGIGTNALRG